jgi:hypothetical protein
MKARHSMMSKLKKKLFHFKHSHTHLGKALNDVKVNKEALPFLSVPTHIEAQHY